ncbi:tetratricopeptide repeat protein [Winogradskyella sp. R77965]|uniref:tetratricopeptide repeat protein n=1 Tax=Winogradskyella sp. R77965 TaxID=3093872 RepID=UPI0037DC677F
MIQKYLILFAFIFASDYTTWAQSQEKIDSLLNVYKNQKQDSSKVKSAHTIYDAYYESNPKIALEYSHEALKLAKKIDYTSGLAKSYHHKGRYFMITRKIDSSRYYFTESLNLYNSLNDKHEAGLLTYDMIQLLYVTANYKKALEKISENLETYSKPIPDSIIMMKLHLISAKVYMRLTEYDKGFESALKALKIAEALQLPNEKIKVKSALASLYHYTNNKEKSIEIKKELLIYYKKQNNKRKIGLTLNDLGNSNYVIENYDIALKYLNESLGYSQEVKNHSLIGITLFNIGKTYVRLGQTQKGIDYLKKSIDYSKTISHHPLSESWALKKLADVYTEELNQPERAIPMLDRAIIIADSVGNKDDLYQSYRDRSQAYAALGLHDKALKDHIIFKSINDSVYNIEKSKDIERLKTEFETKEKEQQIAFQKNEIDLLEQKAKISKLQKLLLGVGLGLALIAIGFGFYGFRQRIKRNKVEKEKLDNELAFKKKELTTHALHLAKKNEVLENLKQQAEELKSEQSIGGYQHLIRTIDFDLQDDNNWENFSNYFQQVHKDFNSKIKEQYPKISASELRFLSLVKMNLSSKEIASILNISNEGIKKARYRVRKKLGLDPNESLEDLIFSI